MTLISYLSLLSYSVVACIAMGDIVKNGSESHHANNFALVPYSTNRILSQFYEKQKEFNVPQINETLKITQDWNDNGVAGVIWEAAYVMSMYISKSLNLNGKKILELGAGTGLVGICAAKLNATVTLTDLPKTIPLLQKNVDLNFSKNKPNVQELTWGQNMRDHINNYDYVLGADIIYFEDSYDALIKTLCYFGKNLNTQIYLSSKLRYDRVEKFVTKLKPFIGHIEEVYYDPKLKVVIYKCF